MKHSWLILLALLVSACTPPQRDDAAKLTPQQLKEKQQMLEYLDSQKAVTAAKIEGAKQDAQEAEEELEKLREERDDISRKIEEKLEKAEKLMADAKELARKLGPVSAEDEAAAEKLLLEARYFQRDNPTEAKSVIRAKYEKVFETYPRTKAAAQAREVCEQLQE